MISAALLQAASRQPWRTRCCLKPTTPRWICRGRGLRWHGTRSSATRRRPMPFAAPLSPTTGSPSQLHGTPPLKITIQVNRRRPKGKQKPPTRVAMLGATPRLAYLLATPPAFPMHAHAGGGRAMPQVCSPGSRAVVGNLPSECCVVIRSTVRGRRCRLWYLGTQGLGWGKTTDAGCARRGCPVQAGHQEGPAWRAMQAAKVNTRRMRHQQQQQHQKQHGHRSRPLSVGTERLM